MTATPAASTIVSAQLPAKNQAQGATRKPAVESASKAAPSSPVQSSASSSAAKSSVTISAAGVAALQESRETPAQTAAEARQGDRVAKNIVAKQQAHADQYKAHSR